LLYTHKLLAYPSSSVTAMVSAGDRHTVLLRSDGKVALAGRDVMGDYEDYNLSSRKDRFKQVSAGGSHTLLLSSHGSVTALGSNKYGQCTFPSPCLGEQNLSYVQVSAGEQHSVALRSDGVLVYVGMNHSDGTTALIDASVSLREVSDNSSEQPQQTNQSWIYESDFLALPAIRFSALQHCTSLFNNSCREKPTSSPQKVVHVSLQRDVSPPPQISMGQSQSDPHRPAPHLVQASAGAAHTVLLLSDGRAAAFGNNQNGQCDLPMEAGFAQVSAGGFHTVLLRGSGSAVAVGDNTHGQCEIPVSNVSYTMVSAGRSHTVFLRSDGEAEAVGCNLDGQCEIPSLDSGLRYEQVSAGGHHTVLLRSDGHAVVVGDKGEISVPSVLEKQTWYDWAMTKPVLPEGVTYSGGSSEVAVMPRDAPAMKKGA